MYSNNEKETYIYSTDGTTINQGACKKYGRGWIQKKSYQFQHRDKGLKSGKEEIIRRHSHPQK